MNQHQRARRARGRRIAGTAIVIVLVVSAYAAMLDSGVGMGPRPAPTILCSMPAPLPDASWGERSAQEQGAVLAAWRACAGKAHQ